MSEIVFFDNLQELKILLFNFLGANLLNEFKCDLSNENFPKNEKKTKKSRLSEFSTDRTKSHDVLKRRNDAGLSAGESLGACYRSQTFAHPFTSVLW